MTKFRKMFSTIHFLTEWTDFFDLKDDETINDITPVIVQEERNILSSYNNAYVHDCTFSQISGRGSGGAICYTKNSKLLVEYTSFNDCTSTGEGGAIYFGNSGQCVFSSVCGVKCTANQFGQFYLVWASRGQNKNHIIDSSITLTEKKYSDQCRILCHYCGNILCKGVNASNHKANKVSGIRIDNPTICYISYSSFRNNTVVSEGCICCYSNQHYINNTNIIENEQSHGGLIYAYNSRISMTHCSIFGNKLGSGNIFSGYVSSINCSSDEQINGISGKSFINCYEFLVLGSCKAEMNCLEVNITHFMMSSYMMKRILQILRCGFLLLSIHK